MIKCYWVINAQYINEAIVEVYLLKVKKILNTCPHLQLHKQALKEKTIACTEEDVQE